MRPGPNWTCGLTWSLYDFTTIYTYTSDLADLAIAERNADHFLKGCPEDLVFPWDFDVPEGPDRIVDSFAGAITASRLWDFAALTRGQTKATRNKQAALAIFDALCTDQYIAWNDPTLPGTTRADKAS